MDLLILAVGVFAGVALLGALIYFMGGSRAKRFVSDDQALLEFQTVFPDLTVESVHLAKGGRDALVLITENGAIAHVRKLGAKPVVRLLSDGEIAQMKTMPQETSVVVPPDGPTTTPSVLQFAERRLLSDVNHRIMRKNAG